MRNVIGIVFLLFIVSLSAFQINGDLKNWSFEDFIGFDEIGDCTLQTGDVSSVFARVENERLFFTHYFR